jgi:hypothetical protein
MQATKEIAKKVVELVDQGLVRGLGIQQPGQMCVEAAVCFAFGLPQSDKPPCVGQAVRAFKIRLNDSCWSTNVARAKGMKRLAVAQLGSDSISQRGFVKAVLKQYKLKMPEKIYKGAEAAARETAAWAAWAGAWAAWAAAREAAAAWEERAAETAAETGDRILSLSAECAVQALIELKSPGCEWLDLCEKALV